MSRAPGHILVVGGGGAVHSAVQACLESERCEVVWARDAESARTRLREQDVDVVLLDVSVPESAGQDLLPDIAKAYPDTPVIVLTGDSDTPVWEPSASGSPRSCLHLPLDPDLLRAQVIDILEHRPSSSPEATAPGSAAVFDDVPDSTLAVDSAGRVTYVNAAAEALLGVARDRVLGVALASALPASRTDLVTLLQGVSESGAAVRERRVALPVAGGKTRTVIVTVIPLGAGEHDGGGAVLLARDVGEHPHLTREQQEWLQHPHIIGNSPAMAEVFALLSNVGETDATVLICGESGTGKEVVASALREVGARAKKPYVRVNCAALSETLLESELFGHVKGAFTGAVSDRIGRFELADGGTIFLDEIGDMSRHMQSRLLRVLQEGEYERVGESRSRTVDVRIIAATNQDLERKIAAGEFRSDLYYRLNVVRFDLPPLRDRREDIPLLVEHFRSELNRRFGKSIQGLTRETLDVLRAYDWPGNVRELQNCLERAFIVSSTDLLEPRDLPLAIYRAGMMAAGLHDGAAEVGDVHASEEERVRAALLSSGWNVSRAARRLGISRPTIYRKMEQYGLKRPGTP